MLHYDLDTVESFLRRYPLNRSINKMVCISMSKNYGDSCVKGDEASNQGMRKVTEIRNYST